MWLDTLISKGIAWFGIQGLLHPWISFILVFFGFAFYLLTIDYLGYRYFRSKTLSEPLQASEDEKGGSVRPERQNASERLYGGDREHLARLLDQHNVSSPELTSDLMEWKNQ